MDGAPGLILSLYTRQEDLSQGLKPAVFSIKSVRAEARTYLKSKSNGKNGRFRFVRHNLEEGGGVFAELGEGVEGSSPADSSLLERDEHGA